MAMLAMNNHKKLKKFSYKLKQANDLSFYVQFEIRLQNQSAKIGLTPADTLELWLTCAEMPTVVADLVDERVWEGHRKLILDMLSVYFLNQS